ncbi:cellulose binding domain-containing protein [Phytohabitans kaempferiae]|uniref:Cellulose binding domain-containing protein n=1 Tax=Phytohabitans kaempferiae TaxID=1620943 RepID=A0ABV6LX41_9ACTN
MTADPKATQEAVEASIPRQRDAGVMGYVAQFQQFDDSMTGPATAGPASPGPATGGGTSGGGAPSGGAPAAVEPAEQAGGGQPGRVSAPNRAPALDRVPAPRRASAAERAGLVSGAPAVAPRSRGAGGGRTSADPTSADPTTADPTTGDTASAGTASAENTSGDNASGGGGPAEPPVSGGGDRGTGGDGSPRAGDARPVPGKEGRPPWTRTEVGLAVAFVVVAAVAIVGGAFAVVAANRPPTGQVPLPLPTVEAAGERGASEPGELPPPEEAGPAVEPAPDTAPGGGERPDTPSGGESQPAGTAPPSPEASSAPPPAAAELVARYERTANTGLLGLTGYRGKVTIDNRGEGAATGWTVTLSLPAGQRVESVDGAVARQDGALVIFTPMAGSGELAAGGAVAFTFDVPGLLAGEPTGCAIDGRPCE